MIGGNSEVTAAYMAWAARLVGRRGGVYLDCLWYTEYKIALTAPSSVDVEHKDWLHGTLARWKLPLFDTMACSWRFQEREKASKVPKNMAGEYGMGFLQQRFSPLGFLCY